MPMNTLTIFREGVLVKAAANNSSLTSYAEVSVAFNCLEENPSKLINIEFANHSGIETLTLTFKEDNETVLIEYQGFIKNEELDTILLIVQKSI